MRSPSDGRVVGGFLIPRDGVEKGEPHGDCGSRHRGRIGRPWRIQSPFYVLTVFLFFCKGETSAV